ncbi:YjbF family lipoprotein [Roseovarius faecimaris]|uniref:YjbF family lipoprotein n=1 Tax=Roseovarius faecimaris TaxID=2494550 RepID=UPI0012FDBEB6|nr:YjbF family lipoprotein [Roseovarius faecimaris]
MTRFLYLTSALVAGLALAGCSNGRKDVDALSFLKSATAPKTAVVVEDPAQVQVAVNEALNVLDGPLALATFEKTNNNVILRQIASNGPYRTWTSWTKDTERRSITTRNGLITATRGLRNDLMSSDVDQTLALVSSRSSGNATRVQRYLDGENQIVEMRAQCSISRGASTRVRVGAIDRMTVEMTENCQSGDRTFRNIYRVDGSGRVVQSVQWLSDFYGLTVVQTLR